MTTFSSNIPYVNLFPRVLNIGVYVVIASSFLLFSQEASAGAWVPKKGNGYMKMGFSDYKATRFFGTNASFKEFKGENTSYYGEHGLGNNLAVYGTILYQDIEQTDTAEVKRTNHSLGDAEIGLRYQLRTEPAVIAFSFLMKLPYFYDEDDSLPLLSYQ